MREEKNKRNEFNREKNEERKIRQESAEAHRNVSNVHVPDNRKD